MGLALVAQFGFDLLPCDLCLEQRPAYAATLVLGLLSTLPAVDAASRRQVVLLCAALFVGEAVLAAYHAGVEYRWWPGPTACTGRAPGPDLDLMAALNHPGRINCEDAAIRVLSLSMAGWNAIAATGLAMAGLWAGGRIARSET